MIKKIFKQIWASKRMNGWIFAELLVIFVATWLVMDPLYTLLCQSKLFPYGFEPEKVACVYVGYVPESAPGFRAEDDTPEVVMQGVTQILTQIRALPQVLAATPRNNQFVYSESYSGSTFRNVQDTTRTADAQYMDLFHGSDYFKVFRFKDAATGRYNLLDSIPYTPNGVFITETMEERLFGKGKGLGKELQYTRSPEPRFKVVGVLKNFKGQATVQQGNMLIMMNADYRAARAGYEGWNDPILFYMTRMGGVRILLRIHDGENLDLFLARFRKEALPRLTAGNIYVSNIRSLTGMHDAQVYDSGAIGQLRTQAVLLIFFLVNIALAVFATFWLRIKKRRSEIGLLISVGATRQNIRNQLITESLLLFGLAAVTGTVILLQILYFKGMAVFVQGRGQGAVIGEGWPAGFVNNPFVHFGMVTLLVLLVIGVMVVLGTLLPAQRASRIRPAEALKEE